MSNRLCLVCNCEKTMPLDQAKLEKVLGAKIGQVHISLCRAQLDSFEKAVTSGNAVTVACTQEAPLFEEVASEINENSDIRFVNIRENAGWSTQAEKAAPKIAALLRDAEFSPAPARLKSVSSDGLCLVYGAGQQAMEVAKLLNQHLSVTLLLSDDDGDLALPNLADIPVYRGDIVSASGSFGAFEVVVDKYAALRPSSRSCPQFAIARNGAKSNCSLILDMSGKTPLFTGHERRDGYKRVDNGDPAAVLRAAFELSEMAGEFEKPIYVDYNASTCAHSRSRKTGCNKCLDACPAGAITDAGDIVAIDSGICGGCGACHSVCPTGSISYQYPARSDVITRTRHLLETYTDAGGKHPVVLLHDDKFGSEMIATMARYGDGLPANVIPLNLHAVTLPGHVELLAMISAGAAGVVLLADPHKSGELGGLESECELATAILQGLGLGEGNTFLIVNEGDPERVETLIGEFKTSMPVKPVEFSPAGSKREVARLVFSALHAQARAAPDIIILPPNAPYGKIGIDQKACTLCMACTSACPADAVTDTPGEPKLRFVEAACVQCGLCVNTCPENALSLIPQLNLAPAAMQPVTLYEEDPFNCISCGTPFATKSTIERITTQLAGKHSMFANDERANLLKMCDTCRIEAQANSSDDPFMVGERPRPRTTEDYLAAEKGGGLTADDFLIDE